MPKKYALCLAIMCVACQVGENYQPTQKYADSVVAKELKLNNVSSKLRCWYKNFADDRLNQLIKRGINNNADIKTAVLRLKQARLNKKINEAEFLPQISALGSYNYQKSSSRMKYAEDTHYYTAGFDASWELDLWGKGRRQTEADTAKVKSLEYSLDNIKLLVAAEIANNYVALMAYTELLRLTKQNLLLQEDIFKTVEAKYKNGLSDEMAYNQAKYLLENTQASVPDYENMIETYMNNISTISGVLPSELGVDEKRRSELYTAKQPDLSQELYELPANIIRIRPDVLAAEQQLVAQNALVAKSIAEIYPNVNLSGMWGYISQGGRGLFSSSSQSYNYEPLVSLPLLDWNRLRNNVELQKLLKEENMVAYNQTVLAALNELKSTIKAYQTSYESEKNAISALNSMYKVVKSSKNKYENGLIEFSEILTAQQNLITAQISRINARQKVWQNLIAYYKASGIPIYN